METIAQFKSNEITGLLELATIKAFLPLLEANRTKIQEIPRETFQYGSTDRHQLDVYYPMTPSTTGKTQILVWAYGGGFNTGDRQLSASANLAYATVGSFFAHRGFIVIIPDYRLAPSTIFPGAAEDIRDAILWAIRNLQHLTTPTTPSPDTESIFLMGHSAGATHAFASLLLPPTPESAMLLPRIAGLILHAGGHDWEDFDSNSPFFKIVAQHYGGAEYVNQRSSMGLLRSASASTLAALPRMLLLVEEKDPEWLLKDNEDFGKALETRTGRKPASLIALGHNHISPSLALSSGEGESWAEDVIAWIRG